VYYSFLCQLLKVLLLGWCVRGIIVLHILVSVLASHIYILGYLLERLPSKASLLILLFLFLGVLLLYFLPLLGLLGALKYLPPMALTMLWLRLLLLKLASAPLTSMRLFSAGLTSIVLRLLVSWRSFMLYFSSFLFLTIVFIGLLRVSLPPLYRPGP